MAAGGHCCRPLRLGAARAAGPRVRGRWPACRSNTASTRRSRRCSRIRSSAPPGIWSRARARPSAAVSFAVVLPLAGSAAMGTSEAVGYTAALALVTTAVLYVALGLLRMGWVSTFLSKAVMAASSSASRSGSSSTSRTSCSGSTSMPIPTCRSSGRRSRRSRTPAPRRLPWAPARWCCSCSCATGCPSGRVR